VKRIFTYWSSKDGSSYCLCEGKERPQFANGTPDPSAGVPLWQIEVGSHEEAMAVRNVRLGYGPYKPLGDAEPCPKCGAQRYAQGSGQCWQCDYVG